MLLPYVPSHGSCGIPLISCDHLQDNLLQCVLPSCNCSIQSSFLNYSNHTIFAVFGDMPMLLTVKAQRPFISSLSIIPSALLVLSFFFSFRSILSLRSILSPLSSFVSSFRSIVCPLRSFSSLSFLLRLIALSGEMSWLVAVEAYVSSSSLLLFFYFNLVILVGQSLA